MTIGHNDKLIKFLKCLSDCSVVMNGTVHLYITLKLAHRGQL
jgi:hypothetical protein